MKEQLQWLAENAEPAVQNRARAVLELTDSVNQGRISPDEYQELCRDLARMDQLDQECSNIEMKTLLVTAVWAVARLA